MKNDTGKTDKTGKVPEFEWPFEISGFGGGYENACRRMARAAAEWLRKHPDELALWDRNVEEYKAQGHKYITDSVYGGKYEEFDKAITKECPDCSGAMFGAARAHGIVIFRKGWDAYVKEVMDARRKKGGK